MKIVKFHNPIIDCTISSEIRINISNLYVAISLHKEDLAGPTLSPPILCMTHADALSLSLCVLSLSTTFVQVQHKHMKILIWVSPSLWFHSQCTNFHASNRSLLTAHELLSSLAHANKANRHTCTRATNQNQCRSSWTLSHPTPVVSLFYFISISHV